MRCANASNNRGGASRVAETAPGSFGTLAFFPKEFALQAHRLLGGPEPAMRFAAPVFKAAESKKHPPLPRHFQNRLQLFLLAPRRIRQVTGSRSDELARNGR